MQEGLDHLPAKGNAHARARRRSPRGARDVGARQPTAAVAQVAAARLVEDVAVQAVVADGVPLHATEALGGRHALSVCALSPDGEWVLALGLTPLQAVECLAQRVGDYDGRLAQRAVVEAV